MCDHTRLLDRGVERLILQFSLGTRTRISNWLPSEKKETPKESDARKQLPQGIQIVETTPNVRISGLPALVTAAGFQLVDAIEMPRHDRNKPNRTYYAARFVFRRQKPAMTPEWKRLLQDIVAPALDRLCTETCWRARAYRNPIYRDGAIEPDRSMFSLNFEAPSSPTMGEEKVRGRLTIEENAIVLLPHAA